MLLCHGRGLRYISQGALADIPVAGDLFRIWVQTGTGLLPPPYTNSFRGSNVTHLAEDRRGVTFPLA
jgi:hypothetical protein